jgi:hypothetical protein
MKSKQLFEKLKSEREQSVGHKIGNSRREFLAHGLYSFSAYLALPSIPALFAKMAFADECGATAAIGLPFMCFDMAGGAALAGNFLVGKAGGPDDWLASYDALGWNPRQGADPIDRRFGLPMSSTKSGLFRGLTQTMSAEAQARLRFGSVCHFSPLDTGDSRQNAAALATALGSTGSVFKNGLATIQSQSGGNSRSALIGTTLNPLYFTNFNDLQSGLTFGGAPLLGFGPERLQAMAVASGRLTAEQIDAVQTGAGGLALKERVRCFLQDSSAGQAGNLDPRRNAVAKNIYAINETSLPTDTAVITSAIATNVIDGFAGPSVWTLGGCDYHTGSNAAGDAKDLEMGQVIGRAVEYAHRVQKPFFFQLISDGSCSAPSGTRNWNSDTNEGMQVFGYYRPSGAPEYLRPNMQIGNFTDGQGADRSTIVGADPTKAAMAVFANYCQVQGKIADFKNMSRIFSDQDLSSLLIFPPS